MKFAVAVDETRWWAETTERYMTVADEVQMIELLEDVMSSYGDCEVLDSADPGKDIVVMFVSNLEDKKAQEAFETVDAMTSGWSLDDW